MKYLLSLMFVLFLLPFGCKKDKTTPTADTTSAKIDPDPSDSLVGVYIGSVRTRYEYWSSMPPNTVHRDTTYGKDTVIVTKTSPASFTIDNINTFSCNDSNVYQLYYSPGNSSSLLNVNFYVKNDSMYLYSFSGIYNSGGQQWTREFFGKKQ